MKLASVIDQGDDSETIPIEAKAVQKLVEDFVKVENEGEEYE